MVRVLLLAVLVLLIARVFWRVVDSAVAAARGPGSRSGSPSRGVRLERDPVCGTYVAPASALSAGEGQGVVYFCSQRCRQEYQARDRPSAP